MRSPARGLFITGTDTDVGKTYISVMIVRELVAAGHRVGVYKPAASGCRKQDGELVSDDAVALWQAAGCPRTLEDVCPQRFAAPLAPHLAARAAGKRLDAALLRSGLAPWLEQSEIVLIEGAGGLMSPLGDDEYVADLAYDFGFPLIVVARNSLGTINHTLQTLITAAVFRNGLDVAGIVLNRLADSAQDPSCDSNFDEIARHARPPLLADVAWNAQHFAETVDWHFLARHYQTPPARRPRTS